MVIFVFVGLFIFIGISYTQNRAGCSYLDIPLEDTFLPDELPREEFLLLLQEKKAGKLRELSQVKSSEKLVLANGGAENLSCNFTPAPILHVATSVPIPIRPFVVPPPLPVMTSSSLSRSSLVSPGKRALPDVRRVKGVGGSPMPERISRMN